jgi:hypothetical protein
LNVLSARVRGWKIADVELDPFAEEAGYDQAVRLITASTRPLTIVFGIPPHHPTSDPALALRLAAQVGPLSALETAWAWLPSRRTRRPDRISWCRAYF